MLNMEKAIKEEHGAAMEILQQTPKIGVKTKLNGTISVRCKCGCYIELYRYTLPSRIRFWYWQKFRPKYWQENSAILMEREARR